MANRFFLNALKTDKRTLATPNTGAWKDDSQAKDCLRKYADDIYLEGQLKDARLAHSVPSAYARPILFYQALRDCSSPLHNTLVSEWRGLLAVFGLRSWYGLSVSVRLYEVPVLNDRERSEVGGVVQGDLHLRTILRNQMPVPENDWNRWWLIKCGGKLIGATSPWTIAYTPSQYEVPEQIPWKEAKLGTLMDPISHFGPGRRGKSHELAILYRWVRLVQQERPSSWGMPDYLQRQAAVISEQLDAWVEELKFYALDAVTVAQLAEEELVEMPPCSKILRFTPAISGDSSDLLLKSSRLSEQQKTIVLSREKLTGQERAFGPVLVSQIDLKKLAAQGITGDTFAPRGGKEISVPYVFAEESFFPPKLVELSISQRALQRGTNNYALPLTAKLFEYFGHLDLESYQDMLRIEENESAVDVFLQVPLRNSKYLTVNKTYNKALMATQNPPPVATSKSPT
jgi:hypothetical protein